MCVPSPTLFEAAGPRTWPVSPIEGFAMVLCYCIFGMFRREEKLQACEGWKHSITMLSHAHVSGIFIGWQMTYASWRSTSDVKFT